MTKQDNSIVDFAPRDTTSMLTSASPGVKYIGSERRRLIESSNGSLLAIHFYSTSLERVVTPRVLLMGVRCVCVFAA